MFSLWLYYLAKNTLISKFLHSKTGLIYNFQLLMRIRTNGTIAFILGLTMKRFFD